MAARVPADPAPLLAWKRRLADVGLDERIPMPVQRAPSSIGAGPARSGHERSWPERPRPPAQHQRSERPAPPRKI
jgi:hypothetical protein